MWALRVGGVVCGRSGSKTLSLQKVVRNGGTFCVTDSRFFLCVLAGTSSCSSRRRIEWKMCFSHIVAESLGPGCIVIVINGCN